MFATVLKNKLARFFIIVSPFILASQPAIAAPLTMADIDKSSLEFNIQTLDTSTNPPAGTSTGVTNGMGFTVDFNSICRTCGATNDSKFYLGLPRRYDSLHLGSDFTITFENPISSLLVALSNDNRTLDGPDFGVTPDEISGNLALLGTKISITQTSGGLALFNFDTAITEISHSNDCISGGPRSLCDGWNVAFFGFAAANVAPVPVPAALPLALTGMAVIGLFGFRKRHLG